MQLPRFRVRVPGSSWGGRQNRARFEESCQKLRNPCRHFSEEAYGFWGLLSCSALKQAMALGNFVQREADTEAQPTSQNEAAAN